jgi:hypothetical protein
LNLVLAAFFCDAGLFWVSAITDGKSLSLLLAKKVSKESSSLRCARVFFVQSASLVLLFVQ